MTDDKDINYDNYFFKIFTKRELPFSLMVVLFVIVVFIVPEIIFFEVVYGVSWTNLFWVDMNYINYFTDWFSVQVPHLDLLNILFIFGVIITMILSKNLYDKAYRLKESILKQHEDNTEEYNKNKAKFEKKMWKCFKRWPWYLIAFQLIALPFANFFMLNYEKFLVDPEKTLWMSIESTYSLEFQFFGLAFLVAISFGFASLVKTLSDGVNKKKINVYHPDRVAGFRGFGDATLSNLLMWTITYMIIIFVAMENMINIGPAETTIQLSFYIWNVFLVLAGLLVSIFIFINPLRTVHRIILEQKEEVLNDITNYFKKEYYPILERGSDYFKIEEAKVTEFLKDTSEISRQAEIREPEEKDLKLFLNRMNVLTWQKYYENAAAMREWPWDTDIITKFYFSLLVPIFVVILNIGIVQFL